MATGKVKERSSLCESHGEELANSITHGIGVALSIAALVIMIVLAAEHSAWHVVSVSIFGASLVLLYLSSTLYHSFSSPRVKRVFQVLDHSFIFVLIAGSYTPWLLVNLRGPWGWSLFGVVWALAIGGIVLKAIFLPRYERLGAVLYVLMGWIVCIAIRPLMESTTPLGFGWLVAGGLCYTVGVYFFLQKRMKYAHAIWHGFVLAGSGCHVVAVIFGVLPQAPAL